MRNREQWRPTKFVLDRRRGWSAARGRGNVAPTSWFLVDTLAPHYRELVERGRPGAWLDLGCGEVPLYGMYRERATDVTCVDWSQSLHQLDHIDVTIDLDRDPLPFADGVFDTVLMTDVLEHLRHADHLLGEAHRVLTPGGRLLGGVPFLYWVHEAPHDFHRYTRYELEARLRDAGFEVGYVRPYGGAVHVLLDIIGKLLCRRRRVARVYTAVARRVAAATSLSPETPFPLGYTFVAERPGRISGSAG